MTINEKIAVLQAYKDGKIIERRLQNVVGAAWITIDKVLFNFRDYDYRVKIEIPSIFKHVYLTSGGVIKYFDDSPYSVPNDYKYLGQKEFKVVD